MSFAAFSEEFHLNTYTIVENAFITKYLPWADGDAVRVYLYGLYLCSKGEKFDAESAAKLLKLPYPKFKEIFSFWEECGLVRILSDEPLCVEYLPASAALGKPKPLRPEKYTEFTKELFRRLQRSGKELKSYEMQRIFEFLENCEMEPLAFLLVVEYGLKKDEKFSLAHVLNKAKKLVLENKLTYEQVEAEFADFNEDTELIKKILINLNIFRDPRADDKVYLDKWKAAGFKKDVLLFCSKFLGKGTLKTLDILLDELKENKIHTLPAAKEYLNKREEETQLVFAVARKLGVKVENPRAYAEVYVEKWLEKGYEKEGILLISSLGFQLGYDFAQLGELIDTLLSIGVSSQESVEKYVKEREEAFKILLKIQSKCSLARKSLGALDMVAGWRRDGFSEKMIFEAAARSAQAQSPLSYMNKLISDWKKEGVYTPSEIPERAIQKEYKQEAAIAADKSTERDRFYAIRRQSAIAKAEKNRARAQEDEDFCSSETVIKKGEIELAKAELYAPQTLPDILSRMQEANEKRKKALERMGLTEKDLQPRFTCPKCSDTGFLPNGAPCDCYQQN